MGFLGGGFAGLLQRGLKNSCTPPPRVGTDPRWHAVKPNPKRVWAMSGHASKGLLPRPLRMCIRHPSTAVNSNSFGTFVPSQLLGYRLDLAHSWKLC